MDNALLPEESNEKPNRSARISVLTWHPKEGEALNLFTHIRPPTYGFTERLAVDSHGLPVRMALTAGVDTRLLHPGPIPDCRRSSQIQVGGPRL